MADSSRPQPYQPGAVSLFFVAKAGVFAAAFWIWLLVLVLRTDAATGAHVLAATGAITTTLVAVVLGIRMALQHNAAVRHAEMKKLLVDISWNAFAAAGNAESAGTVVPFPAGPADSERPAQRAGSERVSAFDRGPGERLGGRDRGNTGDRRR
ncbi:MULTISPECIES: hypothetical protein [unclassified Micromonospora]|uniref:hypothetical protein n=1 Tax=unclassified Micromonospora TaxID=2617518 RepID=UPI000EF537F5|nr:MULTISPECIES: hypothetical protein [unclassified Micromonospora]RLP78336.1 hypothetical protein EAD89_29880 [Micromonospora sp. BL4]RLP91715.1 hypothetical protein EAD98_23135 [Micromonospora sp. CV4]